MYTTSLLCSSLAILLAASAVKADFEIWRMTEMESICVDSHCHAEPTGYGVRIAKKGDCDHPSGDAQDPQGHQPIGTTDGMFWKDGVCGSAKPYTCKSVDGGAFDCAGPNGEDKMHCTGNPPNESTPMWTCHHGVKMGNDVYNRIMKCTGPLNC